MFCLKSLSEKVAVDERLRTKKVLIQNTEQNELTLVLRAVDTAMLAFM